jgi:hypothetical protein
MRSQLYKRDIRYHLSECLRNCGRLHNVAAHWVALHLSRFLIPAQFPSLTLCTRSECLN